MQLPRVSMKTTILLMLLALLIAVPLLAIVVIPRAIPSVELPAMTERQFADLAKTVKTEADCIAAFGEPTEKRTYSAVTNELVGEQWIYRNHVNAGGKPTDIVITWDIQTRTVIRIRLYQTSPSDSLLVD